MNKLYRKSRRQGQEVRREQRLVRLVGRCNLTSEAAMIQPKIEAGLARAERPRRLFRDLKPFKLLIFGLLSITLFLLSCGGEKMNRSAVIETSLGTIKIELFENQMPITTKNFIDLAETEFYDNTKFHRVISKFMIQGGDPLSKDNSKKYLWGTGGPGYVIEDEFVAGLSNVRGTIAMANAGPNTGGSQFFINLVNNNFLDSKHPVFGKVVEGMEVVDKIAAAETDGQDRPVEDVVVEKIKIK